MEEILAAVSWPAIARAVVALAVGLVAAHLLRGAVTRLLRPRATAQHTMLARKVVYSATLALAAVGGMRELGFDFTVLLGAAGIVTVALGFASQTSASNLISGVFLIGEQAFTVGEVIQVGDTVGEVIAVDLLSAKLRTFDNLMVRVPNETLVKAQITNFTRFPIRRYDLQVGVAYKEHIGRVKAVLLEAADRNPLCLQEPVPLIIFQGFGESSVNLQLSVWASRDNFLALRNSIAEDVKDAFDAAGVEIPFPHRTLYAGSATQPLPIAMAAEGGAEGTEAAP